MSNEFEPLAEALEGAASLLLAHGNDATPPRIFELAKRLRSGDVDAIVSTVSEATGGMGSLNDQTLSPAGADERLRHVIADIERLARAAARKHGVSLLR
jgi:hypothetical protein